MAEQTRKATLNLDGKSFDLPIHSPTAGPDVLDIRKLYAEAGVFTYDQVSHQLPAVTAPLHILMVAKASCCTAGIQSTNWLKNHII